MNYLSSNIRFLRKQRKLSQQQLADDLGIKRSNIAAYETKNVEPRLMLISAMADYFGVYLQDLITCDLPTASWSEADEKGTTRLAGQQPALSFSAVRNIRELSGKMQRMLDGFKVFYELKLADDEQDVGNINNFLVFINHMLEYNQLIENSLKLEGHFQGSAALGMEEHRPQPVETVAAE